jgi:hypothetical protein
MHSGDGDDDVCLAFDSFSVHQLARVCFRSQNEMLGSKMCMGSDINKNNNSSSNRNGSSSSFYDSFPYYSNGSIIIIISLTYILEKKTYDDVFPFIRNLFLFHSQFAFE